MSKCNHSLNFITNTIVTGAVMHQLAHQNCSKIGNNRTELAHPTRTMPTQCHIHCVPKAAAASKSACIATCGRICQKFPGSSYGSGVACYGSADSPAALPAPDQISRFAIHVELPSCITVPFHPLLHQCPAR